MQIISKHTTPTTAAPKPEHNTNTQVQRKTNAENCHQQTGNTSGGAETGVPPLSTAYFQDEGPRRKSTEPEETRPRRRSIESDRKNKKIRNRRKMKFRRRAGGAEDDLFLVAPPPPSILHRKKTVGLEREEASRSGFKLERGQRFFVTVSRERALYITRTVFFDGN
jgi:hypothetical protein